MSELAKVTGEMTPREVAVSPFVRDRGPVADRLADLEDEGGPLVPAEQVFGLVERYEDRVDGLIQRVTDQATEVNELTRNLEVERRAALGARHRLQVAQLEAKQQVEEIVHGAERARLEAENEVTRASLEAEAVRREAAAAAARLQQAESTIHQLEQRLEIAERLRQTPWYALKERRALRSALTALPEPRP